MEKRKERRVRTYYWILRNTKINFWRFTKTVVYFGTLSSTFKRWKDHLKPCMITLKFSKNLSKCTFSLPLWNASLNFSIITKSQCWILYCIILNYTVLYWHLLEKSLKCWLHISFSNNLKSFKVCQVACSFFSWFWISSYALEQKPHVLDHWEIYVSQ